MWSCRSLATGCTLCSSGTRSVAWTVEQRQRERKTLTDGLSTCISLPSPSLSTCLRPRVPADRSAWSALKLVEVANKSTIYARHIRTLARRQQTFERSDVAREREKGGGDREFSLSQEPEKGCRGRQVKSQWYEDTREADTERCMWRCIAVGRQNSSSDNETCQHLFTGTAKMNAEVFRGTPSKCVFNAHLSLFEIYQ